MVLPSSSTKVSRVTPRQPQTESRTRGGSILDSWLELNWKSVRSSSSTSIFACIGTSTTMPIPWYIKKIFINLCVSGRYCKQCDGNGAREKNWCIESWNLMPLTTDIFSGNVVRFMKLEESMAGKGFQTSGNVFQIGGNAFYNQKNKIPMKIPGFKKSRIGIIAEFRGFLSGFPNQATQSTPKLWNRASPVILTGRVSYSYPPPPCLSFLVSCSV